MVNAYDKHYHRLNCSSRISLISGTTVQENTGIPWKRVYRWLDRRPFCRF